MKDFFKQIIPDDTNFILASGSPRRKQILESLGIDFKIIKSDFDEESIPFTEPALYVQQLATAKANDVSRKITGKNIILAADTTVFINGRVLNKPLSKENAKEMLKELSGNSHSVFTGISLINTVNNKTLSDYKETKVFFRELEDSEIVSYIASGSPMDKAGSYGIQDDFGATFVSRIEGCFYNVVGLPVELFYSMLKNIY